MAKRENSIGRARLIVDSSVDFTNERSRTLGIQLNQSPYDRSQLGAYHATRGKAKLKSWLAAWHAETAQENPT